MASNPNYVKKQITVDTVSWTAIVAPIDCMGVSIKKSVLVNSLLVTAGFPPISLEEDSRRGMTAMSPVRRRTWTQIVRDREMAAGKSVGEK